MTNQMACTGILTNIKHMKSTGALKIEIEIPKEMANTAFEHIGGFPDPAKSRWCAIAVMSDEENRPLGE